MHNYNIENFKNLLFFDLEWKLIVINFKNFKSKNISNLDCEVSKW